MAEYPSQSWRSLYWRFKSNVNLEELSLSGFKRMVPSFYDLTYVKKNRSIIAQCTTRPVHRRTKQVVWLRVPVVGLTRRPAPVVAWSCCPLGAMYSGLVRPLLRPARSPSEGPAAPAAASAVPIPNSSRRPAVIPEDECGRR